MSSRPLRAAPPTSWPRLRAAASALIGVAFVLALAGGAAAATAAPARNSQWRPAAARTIVPRRVPSVAAAERAAVGNPRNVAIDHRPPLRVAIPHHATPTSLFATDRAPGTTAPTTRPKILATSDLAAPRSFDGLGQDESGGFRPPDPWVSVNGSYVIQTVNSMIRVSSRLGTTISTVPVWSLFALPGPQIPSDPRILWDATHGRWVAVSLSFNDTFTDNFLNLAISDGADPTAGWTTISISYGDFLPDYPSIASSTDKIVLTDNLFAPGEIFYAADIQTFTWASILAGGPLAPNECLNDGVVHPRAAQVLSPAADVHLIQESTFDGSQVYYRIRATGRCDGSVLDFVDETDFGFSPFSIPPEPRQSPGDTISDQAIDERPTDAIWQNNHLYWVSTFPFTYDAGLTFNDAVVIWSATTSPVGGTATEGTPQAVSAGDGIDDFMGGIGLTRGGTLVTIYSESSDSQFVSMEANEIPAFGSALGTPLHLDDGDATYPDDRWGDFAGVAMDPVGTGSVWATHEVAAADGTWRTDIVRLVVDTDNPSVPGTPSPTLVVPTTLGSSVPVRLTWTAATDGMTDVDHYDVAQEIDGGPFAAIGSISGTFTTRQLLIGHTYQFEVRAIDAVGHAGGWRISPAFRPSLTQSTSSTTIGGTWATSSSSRYSGGSTRFATASGARITFTATSARSIAIVTTKASSRGSFKVYVDDVYKATISTYSTSTKFRQLVYQFRWSSPGTHKVKIVVSGTAHHPRVDVDAFVVLR